MKEEKAMSSEVDRVIGHWSKVIKHKRSKVLLGISERFGLANQQTYCCLHCHILRCLPNFRNYRCCL